MSTTQVVKTSVSNNSLPEDCAHPANHSRQTTDTPGFKPFTNSLSEDYSHPDDHTRQTTDTPGSKPFNITPKCIPTSSSFVGLGLGAMVGFSLVVDGTQKRQGSEEHKCNNHLTQSWFPS